MSFTRVMAAVALMAIGVSALAQSGGERPNTSDGKVTRRIKIRSADPYLIFLLLSGNQSTTQAPETSTIMNIGGNGGFGGGGPGGGNGNQGRGPGGGNGNGNGNNFGNRNGGNGNRGRTPGGGF